VTHARPSLLPRPARLTIGLAGCAALALAGCGSQAADTGGSSGSGAPLTLRLGFLPNLSHAPALLGVEKGVFAQDLGANVTLKTQTFNAGPAEMTALVAGSLDAAFVGPSPVINAFLRSKGGALRIVAGATSGGAGLVVRSDENITSAEQLRGKTLATPQLGNTQDVALRAYLKVHGLATDPQGGGDVKVAPTDNATILQLFKQKQIDGAWVPEPFLTRLIQEAGGTLLVDEATLWPAGKFTTTVLVVSTSFLDAHADAVKGLIQGDLDAIAIAANQPADAKVAVNDQLGKLTQKKLATAVLDAAWARLTFTADPLAASTQTSADKAKAVGLIAGDVQLKGLFDLRILNDVLRSRGQATVDAAGLGQN
jgi:NitT/TauT family transport system substrate-binding protein